MRFNLSICLIILFFNSCDSTTTDTNTDLYFDIESLIDKQIKNLIRDRASLSKEARIDLEEDSTQFMPDSTGWVNEFAAFKHLDILNKPIYNGAYEITDNVKDPNSNLTIKIYRAIRDIPISEFRIYYLESINNLKRIEAAVREANALYSTHRKMSMNFEERNSEPYITKYELSGTQKMILSDTVNFMLQSTIILD